MSYDYYYFRKLQSKPLKFWVIWILHLKVWKFIFYTLKFPSISKSIYFVSWLTLTYIIKWHVGSQDTLVRKAITVNLVSLDLTSHCQVGAITDGETELRAKNDEGLLGFKKYVKGLGFYFLGKHHCWMEWHQVYDFFLNQKLLFNGVMVVEFARGEMVSRRLTWQKKITRQTVGMCLNC